MSAAELEILAIMTTLLGAGTFTLIGLKMFLTYRAKRLESPGQGQMQRLVETVEDLRRDVADTRAEVADLHERVDFAERLLTKARDVGRLEAGS